MKLPVFLTATALILTSAMTALALDNSALIGKWKLVETAKDKDGKPCPFVGQQLEFTADGKMISANMPMPFQYKINPAPNEAESALARNPELKGMELMLANPKPGPGDWSKAPIVYGIELKGGDFIMKVSGYTPARYKKQK